MTYLERRPAELPQSEPLAIIRGQEFFPFTDLQLPDLSRLFDKASQGFELKDEDGHQTSGRIFYEKVGSDGNTGILNPPFLSDRYYTLAGQEDDLREDSETYPGDPTRRA